MWSPDESDADSYRQWIRDAWGRIRGFGTGGSYINFQTALDLLERGAARAEQFSHQPAA